MTTRPPKPAPEPRPEAGYAFAAPASLYASFAARSARDTLIAIETAEAVLRTWRGVFDASRKLIRRQQDAALHALRQQLGDANAGADNPAAKPVEAGEIVFWPVTAAAQTYAQMGAVLVQAQKDALDALSRDSLH